MDSDFFVTVDTTTVFWSSSIDIGEFSAFQVALAAPPNVPISKLPFSSLSVHFTEGLSPITIQHSVPEHEGADESEDEDQDENQNMDQNESQDAPLVQRVHLGDLHAHEPNEGSSKSHDNFQANLRWRPGSSIVLTGSLGSGVPGTLTVR